MIPPRFHPLTCAVRGTSQALGTATVAVLLGAAAPAAHAEEPTVDSLTTPRSSIELGVEEVSRPSFAFGRYDGRYRSGPNTIANIDLYGGGRYDSEDATRWSLHGEDLGLATRSLNAEYGVQGSYRATLSVDSLRHNLSDSFRTPYQGIGTGTLTLPPSWQYPALQLTPPANSKSYGQANVLTPGDLALFQPTSLYVDHTRTEATFSYEITREWGLDTHYRHDFKAGLEAIWAPLKGPGDRSAALPESVGNATDLFGVTGRFTNAVTQWQFAYEGSRYRNGYASLTFQNAFSTNNPALPGFTPAATAQVAPFGRLGEAPSNQFDQFSATGAWNLGGGQRLVFGGAYGRSTQNDAFLPYSTVAALSSVSGALPDSALHGLVYTTNLFATFTGHFTRDWGYAAKVRYNDRDNRTPVQHFVFADVDDPTNGNGTNYRSNTPFSKRSEKFSLDTDYRLTQGQVLALGGDYERVHRFCHQAWTACEAAPRSTEDTVRVEWRGQLADATQARVAADLGNRQVSAYNQDATLWAGLSYPGVAQSLAAVQGSGYPFWGPALPFPLTGVAYPNAALFPNNNTFANSTSLAVGAGRFTGGSNAFDVAGLQHFDEDARRRERVRGSVSHEASEQVSLQGSAELRRDSYPDAAYGLTGSRSWNLNLEAAFTPSEHLAANVFYSHEDTSEQTNGSTWGTNSSATIAANTATSLVDCHGSTISTLQRNQIAKVDQCLQWQNVQRQVADTLGVSARRSALLGGRLDVSGDLVFAKARSDATFPYGGTYANVIVSPAQAGVVLQPTYFRALNLPAATTYSVDLHLQGGWQLDKVSKLNLGYRIGWLRSADYAVLALQPGSNQGYLPTFESAPAYVVQAFGVSYVHDLD